jgi:hypothetical protein
MFPPRIMATAKASEIVVSGALRKLLAGEFGFVTAASSR